MSKNILITGGAGFIGSNFINYFTNKYPEYNIAVLDKLTYAGNIRNLDNIIDKITFIKGDICDFDLLNKIFGKYKIDSVINFAAETHVDNSIKQPLIFTQTNIVGTHTLLEVARQFWKDSSENKFIQISTDEVYGALSEEEEPFTENTPLKPNSPYSASKASADLIVMSYYKTYNMNINITNCSNNYGQYQHNEKLIPHMIKYAVENKKLPIYGNGTNIRDWLFVEDHCTAIDLVFHKGRRGERYNIGGHTEKRNLDIVKLILKYLGKSEDLINFVEDRKGHDYRYAIDSTKIENELGWKPKMNFDEGIRKTINWYLENLDRLS